ncbi:RidA family protein [Phenylobacterium sp.]|uniref:RidA family protein n=1 Tax=Phenylobacterium sp. TaxID=1871053 RepID=UPI00391C233D
MNATETRLAELGIVLPRPVAPVANYVPWTLQGGLVHISGQLPTHPGGAVGGTVGVDVDLDQARHAARLCGLNLLAQMRDAAGGDLDRVTRVLKLNAFVQAGPGFIDIPAVVNGCSDLMVEVFGDRGRHARSAVGVYRLPLGVAVEIDAVVQLA